MNIRLEATQPLHHVAEALNGAVSLVGQLVSELLVTANLRFVAIHPVSPTILVVIVQVEENEENDADGVPSERGPKPRLFCYQ